jgi:Tfp pilus assembly protein FimT
LVAAASVAVTSSFRPLNGAKALLVESDMAALHPNSRGSDSSPRKERLVSKARGFSLLETTLVVAIVLITASLGFMTLQPMLKQSRIDSAYDTTLMTLRNYRSRAITERRRYIVTFTAPRTITVSFWGVAVPVAPAPVVVQTLTLPNDVQFMVQAGMPNTAPTVPDGFGNGGTAIDFGQGLGAGSLNYVMFMPDGTSQDRSNPGGNGNLNSGVLYLGRPTELLSMRAITVYGSTGRIRGWRLYKPAGGAQWSQQ